MLAAPWWAGTAPHQRQQALSGQLLVLPDGTWWLFGAWARWFRRHPADGRWFPCPPPGATATRDSARPAQPGIPPPVIPAEIVPRGPDFAHEHGRPRAVAGRAVSGALAFRLRSVITEAAQAPAPDYPLGWSHFRQGTPSTVAATWSTMLWCASVPLFDPDVDASLLDLWKPYLAQPFGDQGRLRWLVPPLLRTIAGLYAERLYAGRPDAAGHIIRHMVMTAQALRDDPRFEVKATALLSMLEPILADPALDHPVVPYGDQGMERQWASRCPPALSTALFADTAPGERLQFAFYDLAEAVRPICGDPAGEDFVEPREAAVALLAADLAGYRPDLAPLIGNWLDPEPRGMLTSVLDQPGHALRKLWPSRGKLPENFRPADAETALSVLSAAAAVDFAWCRLAGGIPIPADGFTIPDAYADVLDDPGGISRPAPGTASIMSAVADFSDAAPSDRDAGPADDALSE
jgi:hypothetical protein